MQNVRAPLQGKDITITAMLGGSWFTASGSQQRTDGSLKEQSKLCINESQCIDKRKLQYLTDSVSLWKSNRSFSYMAINYTVLLIDTWDISGPLGSC